MQRTPLKLRALPAYSRGEERMNTVTHIIGGGFGILALIACVLKSGLKGDAWGIVGGAIYGSALVCLYAMSSIYHGLRPGMGKKVMQVMDHCTIYYLIAGTYTPILLGPMREYSPGWAWSMFGLVWGCAALGTVFTAIDLKKYAVLSMCCYLGMGWCILLAGKVALAALRPGALLWLLIGGISYTVGAVFYGVGRRLAYAHSIFHIFVLIGSITQFVAVAVYIL